MQACEVTESLFESEIHRQLLSEHLVAFGLKVTLDDVLLYGLLSLEVVCQELIVLSACLVHLKPTALTEGGDNYLVLGV